MKTLQLTFLLALLLFPACASGDLQETIADQDRQLATAQQERRRLMSERDRIHAENAELQERLLLEEQQNTSLRDRVRAMEANMNAADAEVEGLRASLAGTGVGVGRRGGFVVLDLPSSITFPSGSATLSKQGKSSLGAVAGALEEGYADRTFWIEGHTDNDPIKKSKWGTNLRLSVERAMAVADYLTAELGVDAASVRVAGHGPFDPQASNDNKDGKAANRRVEIVILD